MSEREVYHPPKLSQGPVLATGGAFVLAVLIFLALPLTQLLSDLSKKPERVVVTDPSIPPPPAPPPEPPPEEELEKKEEKPELQQEMKPLDLNQLDVALNPGVGDALNVGSAILGFGVTPDTIAQMDIFELKDLDNNPRLLFGVRPVYPFQFKREGVQGLVNLKIIIDEKGRVIEATVIDTTHRDFDRSAIDAVLQWKFEPGTKNGRPVKVRRKQPIKFTLAR
jgi:protein TonB